MLSNFESVTVSKSKFFIWIVTLLPILLIGLSIMLHPYEDYLQFRSIRVLVSFLFLLATLYLYGKNLSRWVYWHMFFYGLASIAAIFFENNLIAILTMVLNFISFVLLIIMLLRRIDFSMRNWLFYGALCLAILVHIWLLYYLMEMLYEVHKSITLLVSIVLSTIGSFSLTVFTFIYNHDRKSKSSLFLVTFIVLLVFSETFRGVGYYGLVDAVSGQYWARALLVLAYVFLFAFSYQEVYKKNTDLLP